MEALLLQLDILSPVKTRKTTWYSLQKDGRYKGEDIIVSIFQTKAEYLIWIKNAINVLTSIITRNMQFDCRIWITVKQWYNLRPPREQRCPPTLTPDQKTLVLDLHLVAMPSRSPGKATWYTAAMTGFCKVRWSPTVLVSSVTLAPPRPRVTAPPAPATLQPLPRFASLAEVSRRSGGERLLVSSPGGGGAEESAIGNCCAKDLNNVNFP